MRSLSPMIPRTQCTGICRHNSMTSASNRSVNPLQTPSQGGDTNSVLSSPRSSLGVLQCSQHSCWKKFRCLQALFFVSLTLYKPVKPSRFEGKALPRSKFICMSSLFPSASNSIFSMNQGLFIPSAASKSPMSSYMSIPSRLLFGLFHLDRGFANPHGQPEILLPTQGISLSIFKVKNKIVSLVYEAFVQ